MKLVAMLLVALFCAAQDATPNTIPYQPVTKYDAKRDASKDLQSATAEAGRTQKRVLIEVGGDWCVWCKIMDDFYLSHRDLADLRDANFVVVKIYFGPGNSNAEVFSRFPRVNTFPYLFVLDQDGKLLKGKRTGEMESGNSYNLKKFAAFLNDWATIKKCPELKECKFN